MIHEMIAENSGQRTTLTHFCVLTKFIILSRHSKVKKKKSHPCLCLPFTFASVPLPPTPLPTHPSFSKLQCFSSSFILHFTFIFLGVVMLDPANDLLPPPSSPTISSVSSSDLDTEVRMCCLWLWMLLRNCYDLVMYLFIFIFWVFAVILETVYRLIFP